MPIPLSSMHTLTARCPDRAGSTRSVRLTSPSWVNLMALLNRLDSTCLKRVESINTSQSLCRSRSTRHARCFWRARPSKTRHTDSTSVRRLARSGVSDKCPDSMRAMSRMSPINASNCCPAVDATSIAARSATPSCACFCASSSIPIRAFIGVRISWLMVAKNVVLARLASSAASLASCS
ncbi:hypothetical protein D3C84_778910 [compost metagenome]